MALPQPVHPGPAAAAAGEDVWWAALASWLLLIVAIAVTDPGSRWARLLSLPFPVCVGLIGLVMALDFNRNASTLTKVAKEEGFPIFGTLSGTPLDSAVSILPGSVFIGAFMGPSMDRANKRIVAASGLMDRAEVITAYQGSCSAGRGETARPRPGH